MSLSVKAVSSVIPKGANCVKPAATKLNSMLSSLTTDAVSISGKASKVLNPLKNAAKKVGSYVVKALKAVGKFFKSGFQKIALFFKKVGSKTASVAKTVFNWIKGLGKVFKK